MVINLKKCYLEKNWTYVTNISWMEVEIWNTLIKSEKAIYDKYQMTYINEYVDLHLSRAYNPLLSDNRLIFNNEHFGASKYVRIFVFILFVPLN